MATSSPESATAERFRDKLARYVIAKIEQDPEMSLRKAAKRLGVAAPSLHRVVHRTGSLGEAGLCRALDWVELVPEDLPIRYDRPGDLEEAILSIPDLAMPAKVLLLEITRAYLTHARERE